MAKDRESITCNGRAVFYAAIWPDLMRAAINCGWALGLHGTLNSDMDIMAMPWTDEAKPVGHMIQALSDCFTENPFKESHIKPLFNKPNRRVVYTMSIWADWYLDINVILDEPIIDWEQGELMEIICVHDKVHVIHGYDQYGNKWQAMGIYTDGELVKIEEKFVV